MLFSRVFWLGDNGALVRACRTAAQTAIAMLGASTFNLFSVDWLEVVGISGGAAVLSMLMAIDRFESLMTAPPAGVLSRGERKSPAAQHDSPASFVGCGEP